MKVALFKYSDDGSVNIGDYFQTLAIAQHIDQDFTLVDRDDLNQYEGEPVAVIMNGWFTRKPENWPPSPAIVPIFFGFHVTPQLVPVLAQHKEYLRKYAPIGCRDEATMNLLRSWGIEAYVSGCATMTFPARSNPPTNPKLIFVDQDRKHFHRHERTGYMGVGHNYPRFVSPAAMLLAATQLLAFYRDHAGLVITSRVHGALPCAAMGIPVVFTGVMDGRSDVVNQVGIPVVQTRRFPRTRLATLAAMAPHPLSFDHIKERLTSDLHRQLRAHGIKIGVPDFDRLVEQVRCVESSDTCVSVRKNERAVK